MPVSCHFQCCKALLRTGKRRYIKYYAFAFFVFKGDAGSQWERAILGCQNSVTHEAID